jgi:hypothetical protein
LFSNVAANWIVPLTLSTPLSMKVNSPVSGSPSSPGRIAVAFNLPVLAYWVTRGNSSCETQNRTWMGCTWWIVTKAVSLALTWLPWSTSTLPARPAMGLLMVQRVN